MQFSALYALVRTKLMDASDTRWTLQEKKDALNRVYQDFCTRSRMVRGLVTLTASASPTANGTVTSEYLAPSGSEILDIDTLTTTVYVLQHIGMRDAFDLFPGNWNTITGQPIYAMWGDYGRDSSASMIVRVVPDPGAALTDLRAQCVYVPAALSADTDVPAFPSTWHNVLAVGACADLLDKGDDAQDLQQASYYRQQYESNLSQATAASLRGFDGRPGGGRTAWF